MAGILEDRFPKIQVVRLSAWLAIGAFVVVAFSGPLRSQPLFYTGVVLLGLATGPATVSNLSLMLEMTVPGKVGLFIGAWGSASALARLLGSFSTALVRDLARYSPAGALFGYMAGFLALAGFLYLSLVVLRRIKLVEFIHQAEQTAYQPSVIERASLGGEA
jgi:BCD family chlorophyll transporter-like MFS transporter